MYTVHNNYSNIPFEFGQVLRDVTRGFIDFALVSYQTNIQMILIDDTEMQNINQSFQDKDETTDCLSFPSYDSEDEYYIGDLFINIDACIRQASEYNHSVLREFAFLIVHGTLHLLGYNHLTKEEENEMFSLQEKILNHINYRR